MRYSSHSPMERGQIRPPGSENSKALCLYPPVLNSFCSTTRLPLPVPRFCEPLPLAPPVAIRVKPVLTRQGGFALALPRKTEKPALLEPMRASTHLEPKSLSAVQARTSGDLPISEPMARTILQAPAAHPASIAPGCPYLARCRSRLRSARILTR